MSVNGKKIEEELARFEENTEGVKGCSVIHAPQALVVAESSQEFNRDVVQAMSLRLIEMTNETLNLLFQEKYRLESVTIEEENHIIFLLPITQEFYMVVIAERAEVYGLLRHNIKQLIKKVSQYVQ